MAPKKMPKLLVITTALVVVAVLAVATSANVFKTTLLYEKGFVKIVGPYGIVSIPTNEEVYKGARYGVLYSPSLRFNNDTRLVVRVRINGTPADFSLYVSGPAVNGFVEVGKARGRGEVKISIGRYISEAIRLLRELGYRPDQAGPSLLLFITTMWEEGDDVYIGGQIIPVPVIPGKALGKDVVVEVDFRPHVKHKVNATRTSQFKNTAYVYTAEIPTAYSTPSTVTDNCFWIDPWLPSWKIACYVWLYKYTEYEGWDGIFFTTTYLDTIDGEIISEVHHNIDIGIMANREIWFELGAELDTGYLNIPGPGFTITASNSDWHIFDFGCKYLNSYFISVSGECSQYVPKDGSTRSWSIPTFYKDVILATGTYGMYKIGVYDYEFCVCPTSDGQTCNGAWTCQYKSSHRIHWVAPKLNPDTQAWYPYTVIDDSKNNLWSRWLEIMSQKYDVIISQQLNDGQYYTHIMNVASYTSGSVLFFAFGLPLKVFGLGVSAGKSYDQTAYVSTDHSIRAGACGRVELRRYYAPQILLEPSTEFSWQKSELVQPAVPAYWPYTYKCQ